MGMFKGAVRATFSKVDRTLTTVFDSLTKPAASIDARLRKAGYEDRDDTAVEALAFIGVIAVLSAIIAALTVYLVGRRQ